ncbi:hypothetical protein [Streptomyces sp. NPDC002644]
MSEEQAVREAIARRHEMGEPRIDHGTARTIAAWFNDGADTSVYSFVSTGAIHEGDGEYLYQGLTRGVDDVTLRENRWALSELGVYIDHRVYHGETAPVAGWSGMWVS